MVKKSAIQVLAVLTMGLVLILPAGRVWADALCSAPPAAPYVQKLTSELQKYAPLVTNTGSFATKVEYPGNDATGSPTAAWTISFNDQGKTLFSHKSVSNTNETLTIKPAKSKAGEAGLLLYFEQGRLGNCVYSLHAKNGKFILNYQGHQK